MKNQQFTSIGTGKQREIIYANHQKGFKLNKRVNENTHE